MSGIVDLATGKIIGVEKGTLAYFHEVGHIVYNKNEKGIRNRYRQQVVWEYSIVFIFSALFFSFFKWLAASGLIIYFLYEVYEEKWCWDYARKEFSKKKLNKQKK